MRRALDEGRKRLRKLNFRNMYRGEECQTVARVVANGPKIVTEVHVERAGSLQKTFGVGGNFEFGYLQAYRTFRLLEDCYTLTQQILLDVLVAPLGGHANADITALREHMGTKRLDAALAAVPPSFGQTLWTMVSTVGGEIDDLSKELITDAIEAGQLEHSIVFTDLGVETPAVRNERKERRNRLMDQVMPGITRYLAQEQGDVCDGCAEGMFRIVCDVYSRGIDDPAVLVGVAIAGHLLLFELKDSRNILGRLRRRSTSMATHVRRAAHLIATYFPENSGKGPAYYESEIGLLVRETPGMDKVRTI